MIVVIIAAAVGLIGGLIGYVRYAGDDATTWHVDPLLAPTPSSPNAYRVGPEHGAHGSTVSPDSIAPTFPVSAADLGAAFDAVALADDRVEVVAGSAGEGHVTYVQRSKTMAYPDYVSVRFIDLGDDTSTLAAFSRARYGYSDLGVNQKRVERWMSATSERVG